MWIGPYFHGVDILVWEKNCWCTNFSGVWGSSGFHKLTATGRRQVSWTAAPAPQSRDTSTLYLQLHYG